MYPGTRFQGKSPLNAKPILTAGFRCAPETAPMNRMMAMTMSPGATTAASRPTLPGITELTTPAPAATRTRKNVPNTSANILRPSKEELAKFFRIVLDRSALDSSDEPSRSRSTEGLLTAKELQHSTENVSTSAFLEGDGGTNIFSFTSTCVLRIG